MSFCTNVGKRCAALQCKILTSICTYVDKRCAVLSANSSRASDARPCSERLFDGWDLRAHLRMLNSALVK